MAEAEAFNLPMRVRPGAGSGRVVTVDRPGVSVEAVKMADREPAVVVRICEVRGARGLVTVTPGFAVTAVSRTDLLERDTEALTLTGGGVRLELRPFELVTLKFGV
jgi:alpha-mannosidase